MKLPIQHRNQNKAALQQRKVSIQEADVQTRFSKKLGSLNMKYPYRGFIDIRIDDLKPFQMFSNNDDRVAQFYFWFGKDAFEPTSLKLWRKFSANSNVIFDIGSFTGLYTLASGRSNPKAKIFTFEPIPEIYFRLKQNVLLNATRLNRFSLQNKGLSDQQAELDIYLYQQTNRLLTGSSLKVKSKKEPVSKMKVDVTTLDSFVAENSVEEVSLMKIDAELCEREVINGGIEVIKKHNPTLLVEVSNFDWLKSIKEALPPNYSTFQINEDDLSVTRYTEIDVENYKLANILYTTLNEEDLQNLIPELKIN